MEHSADGAVFKLDPARLVYSLRWKHNAQPPDFELLLLRDEEVYGSWVNAVNLMLLAELRRWAPDAIDWGALFASGLIDMLDAFEAAMDSKAAAVLMRPRGEPAAAARRARTKVRIYGRRCR